MSRDERHAEGQGANLPLPEELRRGLLEIATGERLDRDGEARTAELESVRWPRLEPSAALMRRLLEIPAPGRRGLRHVGASPNAPPAGDRTSRRRTASGALAAATPFSTMRLASRGFSTRLAVPDAWRGPGRTVAASYLLAVALTLALGDPLSFGRRASSEFRAAAGEHLLGPASRAGASIHTELSQRLGRLQGDWPSTAFLREPLNLPADRVSAWFRGAVDSLTDTFSIPGRGAAEGSGASSSTPRPGRDGMGRDSEPTGRFGPLADLLPFADFGGRKELPATNRSRPYRPGRHDDRERTLA